MAEKATYTAEQNKALTALAQDAMGLSEAESAITERTFGQIVALYVKASIALWKAVNVFGGKDADKAGAESVGLVKAALKSQGKEWKPSDSQLSRFRTLRHHTENRQNAFVAWSLEQEKAPTIGEYVSFIGRIVRGDANEDGTLTEQGQRKENKQKREKAAKAKVVLTNSETFDVTTLFGASATKAEKAAELMALIHDLNRELSALKLNATDSKAAKRKLADKIEAARKAK